VKIVTNGEKRSFFLEMLTIGVVDCGNSYTCTYGCLVEVIDSVLRNVSTFGLG
jgi:hypothetical protein